MLVCIEGGIASGKSTFIRRLKRYYQTHKDTTCQSLNLIFIEEPIDRWTNISGANLLQLFYDDQARWGFTFQMEAFLSRVQSVEEAMRSHSNSSWTEPIFILERSWINDRQVFGHLLHRAEKMTDMEWKIYTDFHSWLTTKAPKIDKMIYLDTPPELCLDRKKYRDREEEEGVSDEYIKLVAQRYQMVYDPRSDYLISSDASFDEFISLISPNQGYQYECPAFTE